MSDRAIEIGSEWVDRNESNEVYTVKKVGLNTDDGLVYVLIDEVFEGWDIFSKSDFIRKFKPKADMVNHLPHYKDASGVGCTEIARLESEQ